MQKLISQFCGAAVVALATQFVLFSPLTANAADINREWVDFTPPSDIRWVKNPNGSNESAILFGDPSKPGPYVARIKWYPGKFSRPHFHPNDRFFVVISGTWWMGTGAKYDPDSTVPAPAGSYVIHRAKGIHYDGAKDQETIIQVWGMGPPRRHRRKKSSGCAYLNSSIG